MSEKEVTPTKISTKVWAYLALWAIFVSVLLTTATLFLPQPWGSGCHLGPSAGVVQIQPMPFVVMLFCILLAKFAGLKFDPKVLALLYIVTLACTWRTVYKGFYCVIAPAFHARIENQEIHGIFIPYFWLPSAEAIRALFYPNPAGFFQYAGEWAPVITTYIVWQLITLLYAVGFACVYRRLWVDIELMPFPHAQGWVLGQIASGQTNGTKTKVALIAALLAFLFLIPYYVYTAYPGFPDLYGWITNPAFVGWAVGSLQLHNAYPSLRPIILGPLGIQTNPVYYAYLLLAPLDSLFSMVVSIALLYWIIPQILYYFGYYSGLPTGSYTGKSGLIHRYPPLKTYAMFFGGVIGCVVFHVLLHWRYYADTIKSAISGKYPEGEISYRWAYAMILIGFIGLIAIFMATGVSLPIAAYTCFVVWVQMTAWAQSRGYTSIGPRLRGRGFYKWIWGETIPPAPQCGGEKLFVLAYVNRWATGADTFGPHNAPMVGAMDSFAVARMAGLEPKLALYAILLGGVISTVIVVPLTIYELYYFGWMVAPVSKEWDFFWDGDAGAYQNWPAYPPWWPNALAGLILAFVLTYMRLRYAWWPLEPWGFIIAHDWYFVRYVMTLTPLVAWIIKYVTLKIGGRRVYENYMVPACTGVIAGFILGVVVISLIAIARWFAAY